MAEDKEISVNETQSDLTANETVPDAAPIDTVQDAEIVTDPIEPQPVETPVTPVAKKSGFIGMVFGGAVCAALGFGAAVLTQQNSPLWPVDPAIGETKTALDAQSKQIADLVAQIAELQSRPVPDVTAADLTPITDGLSAIPALDKLLGDIGAGLDKLTARVEALEKSTIEAAIPDELVAKYRAEVENISAMLESQRAELTGFMDDAKAKAADAAETARNTVAIGALDRIAAAIDTGADFSAALDDYKTAMGSAPDALSVAATDGVKTLQDLSNSYAAAARAALSAARSEMDQGQGIAKLGNFLKSQFNARSVTPKAGDDADAVLSRVEQALRDGDVSAALTEIGTLPQSAQDQMADWVNAAKTRVAAQSAIDTLKNDLQK